MDLREGPDNRKPPPPADGLTPLVRGLVLFQHKLVPAGVPDVLLGDAPVGPRTAQLSQIDAELLSDPADDRGRLNPTLC